MEHIQDVYKKKPEMVGKLFDNLTKVNLKVDGKPFQVLYNEEDDELEFHGRSGNETKVGPMIDDMYRLFSKPINDAISHIETRKDVFKEYRFLTFEVISETLLLTAVITKDGKFVDDPDEIDSIAKKLETDVMPCLWKGKLSEEQRTTIMDAISTDIIPTKNEFIEWVKSLFGTYDKFPKSLISRSEEYIEGIVFFFNVNGKVVEYKLVDPTFRQSVKDNHANMKTDGEQNAEKYNEIYEIFVEWAEENAEKLDDNRMRSIEFNFIEMMRDSQRYNRLMKLGTGLTTITTDAYFLQQDRISKELKAEIRKHGDVYRILYEKFVRLFWKPKKRGFVVSKEFQDNVNSICSLFEGMIIEEDQEEQLITDSVIIDNIDEIEQIFEKQTHISLTGGVSKKFNEFKEALGKLTLDSDGHIPTEDRQKIVKILNIWYTEDDIDECINYISKSGLNKEIVSSMISSLSVNGAKQLIDRINKCNSKDKQDQEDTSLLRHFEASKICGKNAEGKDNDKLIVDFNLFDIIKNELKIQTDEVYELFCNQISGEGGTVGSGENITALIFSDARKSDYKGDIVIFGSGKHNVEFKYNKGKLSTLSNGKLKTMSAVWNELKYTKDKFNVNFIEFIKQVVDNQAKSQTPSDANTSNTDKTDNNSYDESKFEKQINEDNEDNPLIKEAKDIDNTLHQFFNVSHYKKNLIADYINTNSANITDVNKWPTFNKVIGIAAILYYSLYEGFEYLLVMSEDDKKIELGGLLIKCKNGDNVLSINDLINAPGSHRLKFTELAQSETRGGGGMTIDITRNSSDTKSMITNDAQTTNNDDVNVYKEKEIRQGKQISLTDIIKNDTGTFFCELFKKGEDNNHTEIPGTYISKKDDKPAFCELYVENNDNDKIILTVQDNTSAKLKFLFQFIDNKNDKPKKIYKWCSKITFNTSGTYELRVYKSNKQKTKDIEGEFEGWNNRTYTSCEIKVNESNNQSINVFLGYFQPFHKEHFNYCRSLCIKNENASNENIHNEAKLLAPLQQPDIPNKIILACVKDTNGKIDFGIIRQELNILKRTNDWIEDVIILEGSDQQKILDNLNGQLDEKDLKPNHIYLAPDITKKIKKGVNVNNDAYSSIINTTTEITNIIDGIKNGKNKQKDLTKLMPPNLKLEFLLRLTNKVVDVVFSKFCPITKDFVDDIKKQFQCTHPIVIIQRVEKPKKERENKKEKENKKEDFIFDILQNKLEHIENCVREIYKNIIANYFIVYDFTNINNNKIFNVNNYEPDNLYYIKKYKNESVPKLDEDVSYINNRNTVELLFNEDIIKTIIKAAKEKNNKDNYTKLKNDFIKLLGDNNNDDKGKYFDYLVDSVNITDIEQNDNSKI